MIVARFLLRGALLVCLAAAAPAGAKPAGAEGPERRAILDALRKAGDLPNRVFVVRALRVSDGWAWAEVDPRSRDGKQRYEPESALLQRGAHGWTVVDSPCGEEDCDSAKERARIRRAHPQAPASLFGP